MKESNYNFFVHYKPDNIHIGYNCVSGGMYIFNDIQFKEVNNIINAPDKHNGKDTDIIKEKLIKGRFLIDDDIDEIKALKLRNNMTRFNPNGLGMVITPTLSCNFNCPYCYVDRKKIEMNKEKLNAVKIFYTKKIQKTDGASVCWTGGEPLLALDVVEFLNEHFLNEARKKKLKFHSSMITNGYLLKSGIIDRLKKIGINVLQITLDGYKEYHDRLRFTLGGKKTYSTILKNVIQASNSGLKIILRSNVGKENYESIYKLIDDLSDSGLDKDNVLFVPCMVMDVGTSKGHYCGNCFNNKEFASVEPELILYSIKKGFKISKEILSTHSTYCGANTLSLFVVDSYANILKCWCNLGRGETNKIGYLNENGDLIYTNYKNVLQWMSWDPFDIEQCRKCSVLPICMGGCMYYNVMGETDIIEIGCSHRKYNLEEVLKVFYIYCKTNGSSLSNDIKLLTNTNLNKDV